MQVIAWSRDPHAELKAAITEAFECNRGRYGHRRVHQVLINAGWSVAKKTVLKLMRALGLVCCHRVREPWDMPRSAAIPATVAPPVTQNMNRLLRDYFPKRSDLNVHSPRRLAEVAVELNNRPRKILDWDTPADRFGRLVETHRPPPCCDDC
ncbi:IS3 family transposase (plasmid) [Rhodococcus globerulus]|uniref:IS3 family transposase n=1 Tax=Rhodococcus globerulus TaxID=33008 RepID=UPI0039EBDEA2